MEGLGLCFLVAILMHTYILLKVETPSSPSTMVLARRSDGMWIQGFLLLGGTLIAAALGWGFAACVFRMQVKDVDIIKKEEKDEEKEEDVVESSSLVLQSLPSPPSEEEEDGNNNNIRTTDGDFFDSNMDLLPKGNTQIEGEEKEEELEKEIKEHLSGSTESSYMVSEYKVWPVKASALFSSSECIEEKVMEGSGVSQRKVSGVADPGVLNGTDASAAAVTESLTGMEDGAANRMLVCVVTEHARTDVLDESPCFTGVVFSTLGVTGEGVPRKQLRTSRTGGSSIKRVLLSKPVRSALWCLKKGSMVEHDDDYTDVSCDVVRIGVENGPDADADDDVDAYMKKFRVADVAGGKDGDRVFFLEPNTVMEDNAQVKVIRRPRNFLALSKSIGGCRTRRICYEPYFEPYETTNDGFSCSFPKHTTFDDDLDRCYNESERRQEMFNLYDDDDDSIDYDGDYFYDELPNGELVCYYAKYKDVMGDADFSSTRGVLEHSAKSPRTLDELYNEEEGRQEMHNPKFDNDSVDKDVDDGDDLDDALVSNYSKPKDELMANVSSSSTGVPVQDAKSRSLARFTAFDDALGQLYNDREYDIQERFNPKYDANDRDSKDEYDGGFFDEVRNDTLVRNYNSKPNDVLLANPATYECKRVEARKTSVSDGEEPMGKHMYSFSFRSTRYSIYQQRERARNAKNKVAKENKKRVRKKENDESKKNKMKMRWHTTPLV